MGGSGGMAACGYTLSFECWMWARAAALACAVRMCRVLSAQRCRAETPAAAETAGALANAAAWCFGAGLSLGAQAGRFLLSSSHFSFILEASDPVLVPPDAGLTACFFDKSLLVKGIQLLHHIRGTDLSVADTDAVPQAGCKSPLHRFIATGVALGGVERDGELGSHEQLVIFEVAWRCQLWPY